MGVKRAGKKVILLVNMQMKGCFWQKDTVWWTNKLDNYYATEYGHSWKLVSENVNTIFLQSL